MASCWLGLREFGVSYSGLQPARSSERTASGRHPAADLCSGCSQELQHFGWVNCCQLLLLIMLR